jgi:hypothetical protein
MFTGWKEGIAGWRGGTNIVAWYLEEAMRKKLDWNVVPDRR